ncbi:MAG TPA: DUF2145 domain-containing protein, partial [Burkholderiaceae bacterium]|nr:DUF2145 domain-containing protein [Burkholderiaceae bacterium]
GISLRESRNAPWSVRQLYYDCDTRRPRIYDEGLAGFVVGAGDAPVGWFAAVVLPADEAPVERAARDDRLALRLLAGTYSANAYAFRPDYQNCNQWVAELLAVAWGGLDATGDGLRDRAQGWLRASGYAPARFEVRNPLLIGAAAALPWLHVADHPPEDVAPGVFRVSMPASIDAFARSRVPGARRFEFCHANRRIVVREGIETRLADSFRTALNLADGIAVIELADSGDEPTRITYSEKFACPVSGFTIAEIEPRLFS